MTMVGNLLAGLALLPFAAGWVVLIRMGRVFRGGIPAPVAGLWGVANTVLIAADVLLGQRWWAVVATVSAVVCLLTWWRRRKRRRALAAIGAKSRALRAALVRRMRKAATPRPVLRPQPQGM